MLERSANAKFAKAAFYEHINDIDVYVEDTCDATIKIISILLGRALGGQVRLSQVFPLGGKAALIDKCWQDQDEEGRRRVFVVDGDFSIWSCYSYVRLKRLFVLPRYCVENFLFDHNAIVSVLFDEISGKDEEQLRLLLDFDSWAAAIAPLLEKLFISYSVSHRFAPELPTTGRSVKDFVRDGSALLDEVKVDRVVSEIRDRVDIVHGVGFFDRAFGEISASLSKPKFSDGVSGKDYLLPLLLLRSRTLSKINSTSASIGFRLAQRCPVDDLESIRNYVDI
ncbi:DUF4435 domain-containing protein [Luteimonas sp. TWI662]|uniref:DUF4435 domain-containing protein n=1 Tax=Luteimonas sp. TWI662 TaxID=3136789 RepID=UPI0032093BBB